MVGIIQQKKAFLQVLALRKSLAFIRVWDRDAHADIPPALADLDAAS
jgi:hypothetical protein